MPRLYTVSHMSAVEWWYQMRVATLSQRESLLEFGSGTTFPVISLVGASFDRLAATDIVAVDPSHWPQRTSFRTCTPTHVPFGDAEFDVVVIRSVVEHVAEPAAVFSELARVMRPGGVLLMNLPNKWDYVSVMARLAGGFKSSALRYTLDPAWDDFPVFYRANTRRALRRALAGTGLQLESFRPLPSEPSYLSFFVPLYIVGALYQFLISLLALDVLQPSFLAVVKKGSVLPPNSENHANASGVVSR